MRTRQKVNRFVLEIQRQMFKNQIDTYIDLETKAGIKQGAISGFVRGATALSDYEMNKICQVLGLDEKYFEKYTRANVKYYLNSYGLGIGPDEVEQEKPIETVIEQKLEINLEEPKVELTKDEIRKQKQREYYQKNKERIKENKKRYQAKKKAEREKKKYHQEYYEKNKEKLQKQMHENYVKRREKSREAKELEASKSTIDAKIVKEEPKAKRVLITDYNSISQQPKKKGFFSWFRKEK